MYLLESPRRGDSNKYKKRMIYNSKKNCSKVFLIDTLDGSYQVYNSKFDFTAKSLITDTVVIAKVIWMLF